MPLPNRVDPFGAIHAVPSRGTMFGNRGGCMHRNGQLVGRPWTNERWICCVLEFKGRWRKVMSEGRYTELFFLDEATAFAAGHRPCMECRRDDARRFIAAWTRAHLPPGETLKTVSHIDRIAHHERIEPRTRRQKTTSVRLSTLPDGVFVTLPDDPETPRLLRDGKLLPWSFEGYGAPEPIGNTEAVTLLTPPSFAFAFAAGYTPTVHPSAG